MPASAGSDSDETDRLIAAALDGNQQAWDSIVRRYWRKAFNIAYTFVGRREEAEDLTQEIFLKVYKALATFDRRANFQTWLISISRNLCIDHYRKVRRERETIDRSVDVATVSAAATGPNALTSLQRRDSHDLLRQAMLKVRPALREAVLLRDIQELAYQEIAERLALPEGTVKSRINRGRRELARHIARLEAERATRGRPVSLSGLSTSGAHE